MENPPSTGTEIEADLLSDGVENLSVQQTLAEQMRVTNYEIDNRKRLLGLSDTDVRALADCRARINERIDVIVEMFYATQTRVPEIALVIGDKETLTRLKRAMRSYIMEMFEGEYDVDYVNKRLRIGKVHKRIGVSPKLYTSALRILHRLLNAEIREIYGDNLQRAQDAREALNTIFMFDMQLVFDTYISSLVAEVESSRSELERYATGLEEQVRDRTRQIEELSRLDMLTKLVNQRGFYEHLRRECGAVERGSEPLSMIFIDLNDFKKINDVKGHREGDRILSEAARIVRESVRDTDIACRYGGDEFGILLPRTLLEDTAMLAQRIIDRLEQENIDGLSFSIGIGVSAPDAPRTPDELVKIADDAMYQAKLLYRADHKNHLFLAPKIPNLQLAAETGEGPEAQESSESFEPEVAASTA